MLPPAATGIASSAPANCASLTSLSSCIECFPSPHSIAHWRCSVSGLVTVRGWPDHCHHGSHADLFSSLSPDPLDPLKRTSASTPPNVRFEPMTDVAAHGAVG